MIEHVRNSILLGIYGSLLTKRQLQILETYYNADMSLSEIADEFNISRQAVLDNVKKGEKKLAEYEAKLHILEDQEDRYKRVKQVKQILNSMSNTDKLKKREVETIINLLIDID